MNDYEKFKQLLEYFVAHLEYCQTEQGNGEGYMRYIKNIKDFLKSGRGYNDNQIQNQIKDWEYYNNARICINVDARNYKSKKCYLNWKYTDLNIVACWEQNKIMSLELEEGYDFSKRIHKMKKSRSELGLFDDNLPNDHLKSFFDKYYKDYKAFPMKHYVNLLTTQKNIILTGAPGTGKTFLAKQIAKQMIGIENDDQEFEKSGQFAFVQFHPSYDYTDFVEGLRPIKSELNNGSIGFELKNGIFKAFCKKALAATLEGGVDNFKESWEKLLAAIGKQSIQIDGNSYKLSYDGDALYSDPTGVLTKNIVYRFYRKSYNGLGEIMGIINYMKSNCGLKDFVKGKKHDSKEVDKKYVFVIDEINRGEISKIFGELFFSIDPNYRGIKGSVKTQYSNLHDDDEETFYVPENVYIIGTMNDIDRSVESFDFAMRRRFTWIDITAEQSAQNMNLSDNAKGKMKNLNEAISKIEGLNASYHIGGAYFLDSEGTEREDYENIWGQRIEPLLKEYLRGMPSYAENFEKLKKAFDLRNENNG